MADIGYENAKVIKRIFKQEGRNTKISFKNKPRNFRRGDVFLSDKVDTKGTLNINTKGQEEKQTTNSQNISSTNTDTQDNMRKEQNESTLTNID